jgi:hypothetical protein
MLKTQFSLLKKIFEIESFILDHFIFVIIFEYIKHYYIYLYHLLFNVIFFLVFLHILIFQIHHLLV